MPAFYSFRREYFNAKVYPLEPSVNIRFDNSSECHVGTNEFLAALGWRMMLDRTDFFEPLYRVPLTPQPPRVSQPKSIINILRTYERPICYSPEGAHEASKICPRPSADGNQGTLRFLQKRETVL